MKSAIYYFSATGNSLYAARRIAESLGAEAPASVVDAGRGGGDEEAELVGLAFPVYLHKAPRIVLDFLSASHFAEGAYVFAVATHNGGPGSCMRGVGASLRKGGSRLASGFGLLMPGNSVVIADMTNPPEERALRLGGADAALESIVAAVLSRERNDFGRREGAGSWLESRFFGAVISAYKVPRHFRASEGCARCGLCVRACPKSNIAMGEIGPVWGRDCELCLACFHSCPAKAIDLDAYTKDRLRYRHPKIGLEELLYR
jgi:ferredoxin